MNPNALSVRLKPEKKATRRAEKSLRVKSSEIIKLFLSMQDFIYAIKPAPRLAIDLVFQHWNQVFEQFSGIYDKSPVPALGEVPLIAGHETICLKCLLNVFGPGFRSRFDPVTMRYI